MGAWGGGRSRRIPLSGRDDRSPRSLVVRGPADVQRSLRNFSQARFTSARANFTAFPAWFGSYPGGVRHRPASQPPSSPLVGLWSPVRPWIDPWIGLWAPPTFRVF